MALASGCRSAPPFDSREKPHWIGVGAALFDLDSEEADLDSIEDGAGFAVDGGLDLGHGPVRPAFEVGFTWSFHDVEPANLNEEDELDSYRFSTGMRLSLAPDTWAASPLLRTGLFYRDALENEFDHDETRDQNGSGFYAGTGLDFWFEGAMSMGPFATYYRDFDGDLEELVYGVAAVFHY
jgi:hypothetical protein